MFTGIITESKAQSGCLAVCEAAGKTVLEARMSTPLVGIILGSKSDREAMQACVQQLEEFSVPYELLIASAHRNPEKVHEWAGSAEARGLQVIVAAAGKAAHGSGAALQVLLYVHDYVSGGNRHRR